MESHPKGKMQKKDLSAPRKGAGKMTTTAGSTEQSVRYVSRSQNVSVTKEPVDDDVYYYPEPQGDRTHPQEMSVVNEDVNDDVYDYPEPQDNDSDDYLNPDVAPMDDEYETPMNPY